MLEINDSLINELIEMIEESDCSLYEAIVTLEMVKDKLLEKLQDGTRSHEPPESITE
jgi:uncharacterized membrane protein